MGTNESRIQNGLFGLYNLNNDRPVCLGHLKGFLPLRRCG